MLSNSTGSLLSLMSSILKRPAGTSSVAGSNVPFGLKVKVNVGSSSAAAGGGADQGRRDDAEQATHDQ